jgi:uncharacterized membrane protein
MDQISKVVSFGLISLPTFAYLAYRNPTITVYLFITIYSLLHSNQIKQILMHTKMELNQSTMFKINKIKFILRIIILFLLLVYAKLWIMPKLFFWPSQHLPSK